MFNVQCCVLCSSETNLLQGGGEEKREEISECSEARHFHCSQESCAVRVGTCLGKVRIWGRCATGSPAVGAYLYQWWSENFETSLFLFSSADILLEVSNPLWVLLYLIT